MSRRYKGNTRAKSQSYAEGTFIWFRVNTLCLSAHEITNLHKLRGQPRQWVVTNFSEDTVVFKFTKKTLKIRAHVSS